MLGFSQLSKPMKWQDLLEKGKNGCNAFRTGAKIHFSEKNILGLWVLSLEHRRFLFDVLFYYKALNGYINIDMSTYVQFYSDTARYPLREKDSLTLKKNYSRTNTFKFSFFNRIVKMWNSLPFHVRSTSSISSFKRGVINFLAQTPTE